MTFTVFYPDFLGECARFDRHVSHRSPRYTHRLYKGTVQEHTTKIFGLEIDGNY